MVENSLIDSISVVCKALNEFLVEYVIVGGTAVALHGYYRHSTTAVGGVAEKPDLDFWYNPTYSNYIRLLNTLESLGKDVTRFKKEKAPDPKRSFFKYEFEKFTLDFLPELKAPLRFMSSFDRRETVTISNTEVSFISYEDLVLDKKASNRSKDITDLKYLGISKKKSGE